MTVNSLFIAIIIPFSTTSIALITEQNNWGLMNMISLPFEWSTFISIVILDFIIYFQHVIFHKVPLFWRFHKVHHIDQDIDVTTGVRFHPIEILLSFLIKCGFVVILGIPAIGILLFEIIINGLAMFNHSNIYLPAAIDTKIRMAVVTPDMHRVHHSVIAKEFNSNYGFNLTWWDRLFGTYKGQPDKGHKNMIIGLGEYQEPHGAGLVKMLTIPFMDEKEILSS